MKANELIKKYRTKLGWTQEEVAKQLYIAKNTYSQYETGKRNIETEMFFTIMKLFGLECFFQKPEEENPNEMVADIYVRLQSELRDSPFHSHTLIHIAYRLEEIMRQEGIDNRWKDYIEVSVSEDKEDIFVVADHKDISFDAFGRVTGKGTCFINRIPPWEQEEINEHIYDFTLQILYRIFEVNNLPKDDSAIEILAKLFVKEINEIQEANGNFIEPDNIPFIIAQSFKRHMKKHLEMIRNGLQGTGTKIDTLLEKEEPLVENLQLTVTQTKKDARGTSFSIDFHIQEIGNYQLEMYNVNDENHWRMIDVWHDFSEPNYICPYCKGTYTGISYMSRCSPLIEKRQELFNVLQSNPIVKEALEREEIRDITL